MKEIKVAELFAGVGGFRLGLEGYSNPSMPHLKMPAAGEFKTVWANQWEPDGKPCRQFAARCYQERFGDQELVIEDIHTVLDEVEAGNRQIPDVDMLVGGFPCQDYSVAKSLKDARGIEGKKGVLWWDIERFIRLKHPRYILLENVDRLLKSPSSQRGRDFAIMLSCLCNLGYSVEWKVINSAEYGCAQRRKRVYIYAELTDAFDDPIIERAFEHEVVDGTTEQFCISNDVLEVSETFGLGVKKSPFKSAGRCSNYQVTTYETCEVYNGEHKVLRDVLIDESEIDDSYFIDADQEDRWSYLKGSKAIERVDKKTGFTYTYTEGKMSYPDDISKPSRTILTGEGGKSPSRMKHVIQTTSGRMRRLHPDELDQLQGFPRGWTATDMTAIQRAYCMGNALVVSIPHKIGQQIHRKHSGQI